jgi:sugar/nucleoside kinase (ribokinase family)
MIVECKRISINLLRIAVASHIALDTINNKDGYLGGAACYCGLMCRQLGFDTILVTKVGEDFPLQMRYLLEAKGLRVKKFEQCPTTRFELKQYDYSRELYLRAKCNPLTVNDVEHIDADGWIVSPIIDEVPLEVLREITRKNKFVILDPQGYTRKVQPSGLISIHRRITLDVSGISAIKVNEEELSSLRNVNPKFLISTATRTIRMNQYQIKLDHIDAPDTTGLGDILTAAFTCAYLKERDSKWSTCYAAGAVKAALETKSKGISKIPTKSQIEKNARDFLNVI